jgi:hypothetical protein
MRENEGLQGGRGVLFFMIKQKLIDRDKMRYTNFSNNMMMSEL